jgi:RNA recognition motif-containing protein
MNIYIGNLNYRIKEDSLRHALEEYGTVDSVKVIKDRDTGHSKGYAFAEMPDDDDARAAIEGLSGVEFQGRPLVVKEALPKK